MYFIGGSPWPGLFVSEGTNATTKRLVNFGSYEVNTPLVAAAGMLYFGRVTEASGAELWRSDGTVDGTFLLEEIRPGEGSSNPGSLTAGSRYLYFVATDDAHGQELWRTDGTRDGTILLKDINAGSQGTVFSELAAVGDLLYFVAHDGIHGMELWRTDGTPEGTVLVNDLVPGEYGASPANLVSVDGSLWFQADDGTHGRELWRTLPNGTLSMVADLAPGEASSEPQGMVAAGRLLYFAASTSLGRELWALPLDGSALAIDDTRVLEGNSGTKTARFTVTRAGSTTGTATATFTTANLGATAGSDYVAKSGTVTFGPGVVTQFIDVVVNGDTASEANESFVVALSGATGAAIAKSHGTGIITDDDAEANLSIELLSGEGPPYPGPHFRITNHGPSAATGLKMRYSQSPGRMALHIYEVAMNSDPGCYTQAANPIECRFRSLAAGESMLIRVEQTAGPYGESDPNMPPGVTITADVEALETDDTPSNNIVRIMAAAELTLPPYLTAGQTAVATFRFPAVYSSPRTVTVTSSSAIVTISPSSVTVPAGQREATFNVTASSAGKVKLTTSSPGWMNPVSGVIVVAAPGTEPRLDVAIDAPYVQAEYGDPLDIAVEVAARRHSGVRPTGIVALVDQNGTTLEQKTLDANAKATFRRTGLAPGNHELTVRYGGDANFFPLAGIRVLATVYGAPTALKIEIPPFFCGSATVTFRVQNLSGNEAPAGKVDVYLGGAVAVSLPVSASGVPGEATATLQRTFASNERAMSAVFVPSSTLFQSSSESTFFWSVPCASFNLVATATAPGTISVTWTAQPNAHHYEVMHMVNRGGWITAGSTTGTTFTHPAYNSDSVFLYSVRAVDAAGNTIAFSPPDVATSVVFTDDPIVAGVSKAAAAHIEQLIQASGRLRNLAEYGTSAVEPPATMTFVRPTCLLALRAEIARSRALLGLPPLTWSAAPAAGGVIKGVHVQELRNAFK
jgi:ELWxxDGT repeat protein